MGARQFFLFVHTMACAESRNEGYMRNLAYAVRLSPQYKRKDETVV